MPEKVLPTPEEFAEFDRRMRARGFRWMTREEKRRSMAHIRKPPPRKRKGAQVGYIYQNPATEHEVWVWSTWVWEDNAAREVGMAWVLIIKTGRKSLRQAEPYLRTENFLTTLRWAAACAKWRVDHRHPCPLCGNPMDIIYGNKYKERE